MVTETEVRNVLRQVVDPELGENLVDLGLIRDVSVSDEEIIVKMVLTASGCPLARFLMMRVQRAVESIAEGKPVNVELLQEQWVPPWVQETGL
jgi:serine O-acetyltransferase